MRNEPDDTMTVAQCRAARALLDWTQEALAERADVGLSVVRDFETGRRAPRASSMAAMRGTLEAAGVEFLADGAPSEGVGQGVRLRRRMRRRA